MSLLQIYKVAASQKDEKDDVTLKFSVPARDLEDAVKKAKVKAREVLDKITTLVVSETEPEPKAKDHPGQTKIAGTEEA